MHIIIRVLANSAAIWIASQLVAGFVFRGSWLELLVAGAILGIINGLVRPLVNLISLPFILLTFGLFHIVINVALLFLAARFIPALSVQGLWAAFWGVVIISVVNHLISHLHHRREH